MMHEPNASPVRTRMHLNGVADHVGVALLALETSAIARRLRN